MAAQVRLARVRSSDATPALAHRNRGRKTRLLPQFEIGCRYKVGAVDRLAMRSLICDRLLASISAGALPNSTHRQVQE